MTFDYNVETAELANIYDKVIKPAYFGVTNAVASPELVIVAGQPGAGKSTIIDVTARQFKANLPVIVNTDDLRKYHPRYHEIIEGDDKLFAQRTHQAASEWNERLLFDALDSKRHVILEGVFKDREKLTKIIMFARERGYFIKLRIIAVSDRFSICGTYLRYESAKAKSSVARFVPVRYHDECYSDLLQTTAEIERLNNVDVLEVFCRKGRQVYTKTRAQSSTGAVDAIEHERNRDLTADEERECTEAWAEITSLMEARQAPKAEIDEVNKLANRRRPA